MFELKWVAMTSSALAISIAGVIYYVFKRKRPRYAVEAFNYLTVRVAHNVEDCEEMITEIRRRCLTHQAVGFDCEWVTEQGKRKPIALVQISTFDGYCCLFRLSKIMCVPTSLKVLLEDEKIYKVGVAPIDDAKYVAADYGVFIKSTLDIRHIVQLYGYDPGGLAALSLSLLGVTLDKTWRIRCSDWSADELTERQVSYAAADAHVAIKIFVQLMNKRIQWNWLSLNSWNCINKDELCKKYADICFKTKAVKKVKNG